MEGYSHPLYAKSFSEIGEPIFLPKSRGWLIKRQIPGMPFYDAMGPYPLFFCDSWDRLAEDLDELKADLVSVALVIIPSAGFPYEDYKKYLDQFYPYKDHYLLDLSLHLEDVVSKGRRKDVRRALRHLNIEVKSPPDIDAAEWSALYHNLIYKHQVRGIRTFSDQCFAKQLLIPGMFYFRVLYRDKVVGANLYLLQGDTVYFHLSAFSDEGYELDASYAVKWTAIQYFKERARWMNLGGATAFINGAQSGLEQFKEGWSNKTTRSYFCGKIFNQELYEKITHNMGKSEENWFPSYRSGEY